MVTYEVTMSTYKVGQSGVESDVSSVKTLRSWICVLVV